MPVDEIRLDQFPSKTTPVPADIIYAGDSSTGFDEVQITIEQLISAYPALLSLGQLTTSANQFPYYTDSNTFAVSQITAFGLALVQLANSSAAATYLGVLPLSGGIMTGAINMGGNQINNMADPLVAQDAATKNYVDNVATGGAAACFCATTGNLNATYNNGVSGVGATLTNAGTQLAFATDGQSPALGARVLVKNQSSTFQNGIYVLTTVGTVLTNWVLTRASDYDTVSNINDTGFIPVSNGTLYQNSGWYNSTVMVTVGSTAITYIQIGFSVPVSLSNGGTNASLSAVAGAVAYSTASGMGFTAAGTLGFPLISNGSGEPSFNSTITIQEINDTNGNVLATFYTAASAVNFLGFENSATTFGVSIGAFGTDTNIALNLNGKGTGGCNIDGFKDASVAASGIVGQVLYAGIALGSAVSCTTGVITNIISLGLTPGDWNVWGSIYTNPAAGTTVNNTFAGFSTANNTISQAVNAVGASFVNIAGAGNIGVGAAISATQFNPSSNQTVYLNAQANFSGSTYSAYGYIMARRIR